MFLALSLTLAAQSQAAHVSPAPAPADVPHDAIVGTVDMLPVDAVDDGVPLPEPAQWRATDKGDVLIAPAGGDPFFLGFAAGKYAPMPGERVDPALAQIASALPVDGRPAKETYAFVMFQKRMSDDRVRQLKDLGARVLSFHPHYCLKVAVPPSAIDAISQLDFVRWIGVAKDWQKVHPLLANLAASASAAQPLDVWIDVFDSDLGPSSTSFAVGNVHEADPAGTVLEGDAAALGRVWMSNGWQQRVLGEMGIEVRDYVDSLRAFRARVSPQQLEALVALDFVQFVEADLPEEAQHDESMPLINADRTRMTYDGCQLYTAHVGVIDSGMYVGHAALDPFVVGWEYSIDGTNAFDDGCGHGSHVSGTILGNGDVEPSFAGAAPGSGCAAVARVFVAKIFSGGCSSLNVNLATVFTQMHTGYTDGNGAFTARPHVVNNSYGISYTGTPFVGTEAGPRMVDDEVYDWNQLYVFAAGNAGSGGSTLTDKAASKNAMTVGSVVDYHTTTGDDPGDLSISSSRGPTADNRWKPNLCAPGQVITSCQTGTSTGYVDMSGTSMATPHVSGVAAQLVDHYSFLQYNPATLSAVLMAGAMTHNNVTLAVPSTVSTNHLNTYGTGRVDAYKCYGGDSQQAMYFWGFGQTSAGYGQLDFPVNAGATRVVVVMHYKEPSASSGASSALVNDLDTYIDVEPFTAGGNTGEYTAQQSPRDNTEIRILNNPTVANWRIKVFPASVGAGQTCKVGVCAIVTYGNTTPTPTLDVQTVYTYVKPNQLTSVSADYTNPSYIASAVFLDASEAGASLFQSNTFLVDGAIADLTDNQQSGWDVVLGDVIHGSTRSANWRLRWATEGVKNFQVQARSDNAVDVTDSVNVYVDGTAPPLPQGLHSTTHTPSVWSNQATIGFNWTQPADAISGVDGYSWTLLNSAALPDTTKDIGAVLSYLTNFNPNTDSGSWYFNLRPVDKSGNWNGGYMSAGPFLLDFIQPDYVTGLASPTHTLGSYSCNPNITVTWNPTADSGGSGLAGYYVDWDHVASGPASGANTVGPVTSANFSLSPSSQPWYFHITPFDHAGNSQNFFNLGPFYIVDPTPVAYCTGKTNSLGCVPSIGSTGTASKSAGNLVITCNNVINNKNGLLFWGFTPSAAPFQGGIKCVASPTLRTPNSFSGGSPSGNNCSGAYSFAFDTAYMNSVGVDPGDTLYAQWWMRDPASASTTGLSNALNFTICQ